MEPRGRKRHRWASREAEWAGAHESMIPRLPLAECRIFRSELRFPSDCLVFNIAAASIELTTDQGARSRRPRLQVNRQSGTIFSSAALTT